MRSRLEVALLFAALIAVAAFVGSFVAGLRDLRLPAGGATTDAAAGRTNGPHAPAADAPGAPSAANPGTRIRVEVLNGAGRPGLARTATDLLRDRGFDVVFYGNASGGPVAASVVLDRAADLEAARAVAHALGIGPVESRPDAALFLDVSVILGPDWSPPPAGAGSGWRDRWLRRR